MNEYREKPSDGKFRCEDTKKNEIYYIYNNKNLQKPHIRYKGKLSSRLFSLKKAV